MVVEYQAKIDEASTSGKRSAEKVLINRQPIYGRQVNLLAYELLSQVRESKATEEVEAELLRGDLATFSDVGLEHIAGDHLAFVSVTRDAILGGLCDVLSKQRVVLEVLSDIVLDDRLHDALAGLAAKGYKIAIDGTASGETDERLASVADIIRIDVRNVDESELSRRVEALSKLSVKLLAENIDSFERFDACKRFDFDFFQGYFFCSPSRSSSDIPVNRLAAVPVLAELQEPEISIDRLEETISHDLSLSYKLLRYANSAYIGLNRQVESISHAAKMIGIARIRLWASLLMFA